MPHRKNEQATTYFVTDRQNKNELFRLAIQNQMITQIMGGVLAEQNDPDDIQHGLDIGCGTGSWIIEVAQMYPTMSLIGIDISPRMIEYAQKIANAQSVSPRVKFQIMDALQPLKFPIDSFNLVNIQLGSSFLRTWDWSPVLLEIQRVTRPGGIIRVIEYGAITDNQGGAHMRLCNTLACAFSHSGHTFEQGSVTLIQHLPQLFKQQGIQNVQTKDYELVYQAGTELGELYYENFTHLFQTLKPFIQKWGCAPDEYDSIYKEALSEIQHPDFNSRWNLHCTWGTKSDNSPISSQA